MTVTADDRRRVQLPDVKPGECFDVSKDSAGRIVLRRLRPEPESIESEARVVKLKRGKDGYLAPDPPVTVSPDEVARVIREERDSR
jgi:hypothetical protein